MNSQPHFNPKLNARISTPGTLDQTFLNISGYLFVELHHPEILRDELKSEAIAREIKGSILLSREGINLFLSSDPQKVRSYIDWIKQKEPFKKLEVKESFSTHVPFSRMIVKVKPEIITMGRPDLTPSRFTGQYIKPQELKNWLDEKKDFILLDTRNDYEVAQGTFKSAVDYDIETFKEFPQALAAHREELQSKPVVMFCTGGIRCEKATALALEYGIKDVYQLDGGILKYFEEVGGAHYRGDCFVFDGREAVDPQLQGTVDRKYQETIGDLALHSYRRCPFAIRVRMVLAEKKIPYRLLEEKLSAPSQELLERNPLGEVPVLVHNGLVIRDSAVINEYLEELFTNVPLMPKKPERRARVRIWTAWVRDVLKSDLDAWKYERLKILPEEKTALADRLVRALFHVQGALQRRPYLVSKEMTLADIHVFPFVRQLRRVEEQLPGVERLSLLWQWYDRMEKSEAFIKAMSLPEESIVSNP
jgi:UPF0176 protein